MANFRTLSVSAAISFILIGALLLVASNAANLTVVALCMLAIMGLLFSFMLLGIRIISRRLRTESRKHYTLFDEMTEYIRKSSSSLESSLVKGLHDNAEEIGRQRKQADRSLKNFSERIAKQETAVLEVAQKIRLLSDEIKELQRQTPDQKHIKAGLRELEVKVVNSSELRALRNELLGSIRDSERKVLASAVKPNEITRIKDRVVAAESRILGTFETTAFEHGEVLYNHSMTIDDIGAKFSRLNQFLSESNSGGANGVLESTQIDSKQFQNVISKVRQHVTTTVRDSTRQVEALLQLAPMFADKKLPLPSTGGFAIDAQALGHLIAIVEEKRPKKILELGSGTTTVWLGYLCRSHGGEVVSIDHLEEYLGKTQRAVERHHLGSNTDLRIAPLQELICDGETYNWYSLAALEDLTDIDMVFIDGPPASTGKFARYPALPKLIGSLSSQVTVVLDDAHRDEESQIIDSWLRDFPDFEQIDIGTSRLAVIQRGRIRD